MKDRTALISALETVPEAGFDSLATYMSTSLVDTVRDAAKAYLTQRPPIRVVHWNLHHGGVPVNVSTGKDLVLDVQTISDWLVKFKPDVVSLNELEQFDGYGQMDQLERHRLALQTAQGVPWYSCFCTMSATAKNQGGGVGLLSRWPLDNPMRKGLGDSRPMLAVQQPFGTFATAHPISDSASRRASEVKVIAAQVFDPATIFCGDFNAVPTGSELLPMQALFQDAWVEAKKIGAATSFQPDGITHGVHRIDYVWFRGLEVVSIEVPDTRVSGIYPSDHHPVIATFR